MNEPLYLFIGGTRDGDRLPVPHGISRVELPLAGATRKRQHSPVPSETYLRMEFHGETERDVFHLFALKGVTGNSVLRSLIEHYAAVKAAPMMDQPVVPQPAPARRGRG